MKVLFFLRNYTRHLFFQNDYTLFLFYLSKSHFNILFSSHLTIINKLYTMVNRLYTLVNKLYTIIYKFYIVNNLYTRVNKLFEKKKLIILKMNMKLNENVKVRHFCIKP